MASKGIPRFLNVNRVPTKPKSRKKVTLVFDEKKRRDFLSGFHKRKIERRQKAQEELKVKLKEEKKRIKQEAREKFKTLVSQRDVPELEQLLSQAEYEVDGKTVSVLELDINDLAQSANWIGENKPTKEQDEIESEESDDPDTKETVPGMELTTSTKPKVEDQPKQPTQKKEMGKKIQKETMKKTKRSKIFQLKQRLDRDKNKKLSQKEKFRKDRVMKNAKGKTKKKLAKKNKK